MQDSFWNAVLTTATTLSDRVGQELLGYFGQVSPQEKDDGSLITQADRWADQALRDGLAAQFPDHGLLTEETLAPFPDREWCWVVDPLDGTTNFARKIPIWGISLGLLYRGWPVFGFVAIPPLGEQFYGFWPGQTGLDLTPAAFHRTTRGEQPLQVFSGEVTKNHLFSFCTRSIHQLQMPPAGAPFPCKIRMLGVATYNLLTVASGICVGGIEATPKVWDIAATWVICQAAGATWMSLKSDPFPLQPGQECHDAAYPALVVAQPDLVDRFLPLVG